MVPFTILTNMFGRKTASVIMVILSDIAITVAITVVSKLLVIANEKLEKIKKDKYYTNTKPEDDYVTVRTSFDTSRSRNAKKGKGFPK